MRLLLCKFDALFMLYGCLACPSNRIVASRFETSNIHLIAPRVWFYFISFLQVNRLELGLSDLQRSQEAQAATAATRAQTTGVLEEYRTRAQQALKRANEITSQTTAENKRLEVSVVYDPPRTFKANELVSRS